MQIPRCVFWNDGKQLRVLHLSLATFVFFLLRPVVVVVVVVPCPRRDLASVLLATLLATLPVATPLVAPGTSTLMAWHARKHTESEHKNT